MRSLRSNSTIIRRRYLAVVIASGLVLSSICFGYSGGSGTAGDPYKIANANDLLLLADDANNYSKAFVLVNDINLAGLTFGTAIIARDKDLSPHGGFQGPLFTGVFDGNGHSILNLTIDANETGNHYLGLFGWIGQGGTVKNLEVNIVITAKDGYFSDYVGGLCGINSGSITNCRSTGLVTGDFDETGGLCGYNSYGTITDSLSSVAITGEIDIGGLCGSNAFASVINCYSTGDVSGDMDVGGLCGFSNDSNISGCFFTGKVTGNQETGGLCGGTNYGNFTGCYSTGNVIGVKWTGGLYGSIYDSNIIQCYSTGPVAGDYEIGGLCGQSYHGNIINCYSTGNATGTNYATGGLCGATYDGNLINCYSASKVTGVTYPGGLCGTNSASIISCYFLNTAGPNNGAGVPLTDAKMKQQASFVGWDFTTIWKICNGESHPQLWYEKYGGRLGDANNPYLIYTSCQMNAIGADSNDWGAHFKLMADIDLGGYSGTEFNIIGKYIGYHDPCNRSFYGVFDGNGHTISNFTYSSDGNNIGIFSYISGSAAIKDLGIINPNITGGDYVGSLVGMHSNGTITNCYVNVGTISGGMAVGGLTGISYNDVLRCYSAATVIGRDCVGGLAGVGCGYASVGNPPGPDPAKITDCYSLGKVSGDTCVGGLVGLNFVWGGWNNAWPATITNCYSAGTVSGNSYVGGLIGINSGEINNCFWDVNSSGQASSSGGTGKTTAEMQTLSTFTSAGWDFVSETANGTDDYWRMCVDGVNYPLLWWQFNTADFTCPDGVSFTDFAILANAWLSDPAQVNWNGRCDIAEPTDNIIDFLDLAVFAQNWLEED